MVRAASERTASAQDSQIILARNSAENGITEVVRQLNGPYSYLAGLNKSQWETTARAINQRRADYYESIKNQLTANVKASLDGNSGLKVGCGTDSNGNLQLYTAAELDFLLKQLTDMITVLRSDQLPAWITGKSGNESVIKRESGKFSSLLNYTTNQAEGALPTQATIEVRGRLGISGNTEAVVQQSFNLQAASESPLTPSFTYNTGLLFKAADSDIGGLDVETGGQIVKDPVTGKEVTAYEFCLANVTCIDCQGLDKVKRKDKLADIAGILTALEGDYDFPREILAKILGPENGSFTEVSSEIGSVKTGTPAESGKPALKLFTLNLASTSKSNDNKNVSQGGLNQQAETTSTSKNSNKITAITVEGQNRAVIQIKVGSDGVIPQFVIQRPDPKTPLPIVIVEGSGSLTVSGNESLGEAFLIAPDVDLTINGGGREASRLITGSLWIRSINNPSNAGGKSSKTFLDGKAEIVVDPEMRKLLEQVGLAQLGVVGGGLDSSFASYRLVPGPASRWTLN